MDKTYDVVIVGSGPAGMFAAYELCDKKLSVLVIDLGDDIAKRKCPMWKTNRCANCSPCNIMSGVGGAGTFSDGLLNLSPDIGGDLTEFTKDRKSALELVEYVDKIFLKFGAPRKKYDPNVEGVSDLINRAASVGVKFVRIPQRHIGTDNAPKVIEKFADYLKGVGVKFLLFVRIPQRHIGTDNAPKVIEKFADYLKGVGVKFLLKTKVDDFAIEDGRCTGVKLKNGKTINARCVIIAPGRVGASWIGNIAKRYGIKTIFGAIDVGVRVEVPSKVMEPVIRISRDPKFHITTYHYNDFVRTFCTNHEGFVVKENYNSFIGVNGHSMLGKKSKNTNFAFLVKIALTEPVENTIEYGSSIAEMATTIGGGKPIMQRFGDLKLGRRSTWERLKGNPVKNTLKDITPGDISMALPHRVVTDVIDGLEKLNAVIPGITADSTLLYAPEVKFYATRITVDKNMQTNIRNLYAAGDGAGLSRDIVNASATGILAARGLLRNIR